MSRDTGSAFAAACAQFTRVLEAKRRRSATSEICRELEIAPAEVVCIVRGDGRSIGEKFYRNVCPLEIQLADGQTLHAWAYKDVVTGMICAGTDDI